MVFTSLVLYSYVSNIGVDLFLTSNNNARTRNDMGTPMASKSRKTNGLESEFYDDLKKSAKKSLKVYFRDKDLVVPRSKITSDFAISTLLTTDFGKGFDYAHEHLLPQIPRDPNYTEPSMKWEVYFLLKMLSEMRARNIPKVHQSGLTLLYFHFCKGWEIPEPVPLP
jgi:hypothetical protein